MILVIVSTISTYNQLLVQEILTTICDTTQYLGVMEEVRGRTLLDEDSVIEMPVVVQEGLICVPGQTLPLTISHPHTTAMMRRVIEGNHIFGILSFRLVNLYREFRCGRKYNQINIFSVDLSSHISTTQSTKQVRPLKSMNTENKLKLVSALGLKLGFDSASKYSKLVDKSMGLYKTYLISILD